MSNSIGIPQDSQGIQKVFTRFAATSFKKGTANANNTYIIQIYFCLLKLHNQLSTRVRKSLVNIEKLHQKWKIFTKLTIICFYYKTIKKKQIMK